MSVVMLSIAIWQGWLAWTSAQTLRTTQAQIAELRALIEQARERQADAHARARVLPPYARDAVAVAEVARFPIEEVFASIEAAQVRGVRVTALEIAAAEGSARVEVEFADYEALSRYVDALNAGVNPARSKLLQKQSVSAAVNSAVMVFGDAQT